MSRGDNTELQGSKTANREIVNVSKMFRRTNFCFTGNSFEYRWATSPSYIKALQALHDTPPMRIFLLLHMFCYTEK